MPPTSAEVKNSGAVSPLPHMPSLRRAELIKHRENFTFFQVVMVYSVES
jgi:hypothetical protein